MYLSDGKILSMKSDNTNVKRVDTMLFKELKKIPVNKALFSFLCVYQQRKARNRDFNLTTAT